jgi:hypothetical protein
MAFHTSPVTGRRASTDPSVTTNPASDAQIPIRKKSLADPVQATTPAATATPSRLPTAEVKRSRRNSRNPVSPSPTAIETPIVIGSDRNEFAVTNTTTGIVE